MYYNINHKDFSERLKQVLEENNLTQVEAAHRLNISKYALTNYLNGRLPKSIILLAIAKLFDKPMEWFLMGEEESRRKALIAHEKQRKKQSESGGLTLEEMQEILKKLMLSEDHQIRRWTVVQFKQAFGEYCSDIDENAEMLPGYVADGKNISK